MRIRRSRPRTGATAVEFAVVFTLFLLIVFGIFEYARYVMMRQLLENAAREGARFAVVHTYDSTTADVEAQVMRRLVGQEQQLQNLAIQVYRADPTTGANLGAWTDARFGESICVQVNGDFNTVLPNFLFMRNPLPIEGRVIMNSEAN